MPQNTNKLTHVMPSATPSEAEIAAWANLSRAEQVRRYQQLFKQSDCNVFATDTPDEILTATRRRVAARRHS
jgi:hypothetical protein